MPGDNPTDAAIGGGCSVMDSRDRAGNAVSAGRSRLRTPLKTGVAFLLSSGAAAAETGVLTLPAGMTVDTFEVMQFAVFSGVMGAALLSAIWLIRERARTAADNLELRGRVAELGTSLQRSESLLNLKDQRLVVWSKAEPKPEIVGSLGLIAGVPEDRAGFLAFGRWLTPRAAASVEREIAALRDSGRSFAMVAETQLGGLIEVQGRMSSANSVVRFSPRGVAGAGKSIASE